MLASFPGRFVRAMIYVASVFRACLIETQGMVVSVANEFAAFCAMPSLFDVHDHVCEKRGQTCYRKEADSFIPN